MFCENCGTRNDQDAVFCSNCGHSLQQQIEVAPVKKNGNSKVIIVIAVFLILAIVTVIGLFFVKKKKDDTRENLETLLEIGEEDTESLEDTKNTDDEYVEADEKAESVKTVDMSDIVNVSASSVLVEKARTHSADRLVDGDLAAAWTEGADGYGIGESVTVYFDDICEVKGFYIHAGYHKSEKLYWENARPRIIEIICGDESYGEYSLRDYFGEQEIVFDKPIQTSQMTILVKDVFTGTKYEDTVISEVYFY